MNDSKSSARTRADEQERKRRAAQDVFDRYALRLSRLAEQHLNQRLRTRIDGADIVQSVLRTFFRRSALGQFNIDSSADLWRLLAHITLMRVREKARFHGADRRNIRTEEPGTEGLLVDGVSRDPDPAEAALVVETLERLVVDLPELHAQVLDLRLQGFGSTEIATQLKVSRSTVQRALRLLQQRLAREQSDQGPLPQ
jgi:RNA polymerase sigma factor (sigma-70 family)